ncbi:hypothetical protein [Oceanicoccus sp. KOV_DT_Chl]|uniref:hypothetical protein n=1 Tax=Oceanicoccus sp. KOV_DT_Chl TaxID=1904639 RepID=UPI000C7E6A61|nr:hypothetical protein [Oceanicoccus sp. KOV_DT_Chl]
MKNTITSRKAIASLATLLLVTPLGAYAGSCNFVQENMFAGPFNVCASPVDAGRCEEFGDEGSNADANYTDASCVTDKVIGTCVMEEYTLIYYSGEADSLEVGCSFQGGNWK